MQSELSEPVVEAPDAEVPDLDFVTGYEDADGYVICEKSNPKAWIRADETTQLSN